MKKFILIIGILSVVEGIWTMIGGKILIRSKGYLSTSINYSICSILIGTILIYISKRFIKKEKYVKIYSICSNCQESYNYIDLKDGLCPYCNIQTLDIKEYYKDKKNDEN